MDLDFFVTEWNKDLHHLFDFVAFSPKEFGHIMVNNWGFMAKAGHPVVRRYLDKYKENYLAVDKPFNLKRCYWDLSATTLYDTGPYFATMNFYFAG